MINWVTYCRDGSAGVAQVEGAVAEPLDHPVHLVDLAVLPVELLLAGAAPPRQLSHWNRRGSCKVTSFSFIFFFPRNLKIQYKEAAHKDHILCSRSGSLSWDHIASSVPDPPRTLNLSNNSSRDLQHYLLSGRALGQAYLDWEDSWWEGREATNTSSFIIVQETPAPLLSPLT